jgi:hypothetical protein
LTCFNLLSTSATPRKSCELRVDQAKALCDDFRESSPTDVVVRNTNVTQEKKNRNTRCALKPAHQFSHPWPRRQKILQCLAHPIPTPGKPRMAPKPKPRAASANAPHAAAEQDNVAKNSEYRTEDARSRLALGPDDLAPQFYRAEQPSVGQRDTPESIFTRDTRFRGLLATAMLAAACFPMGFQRRQHFEWISALVAQHTRSSAARLHRLPPDLGFGRRPISPCVQPD